VTAFGQKSFSVPTGGRKPEDCAHGWVAKGRCVFCGQDMTELITKAEWVRLVHSAAAQPSVLDCAG
jgi:hypothetical protein